MAQKILTIREWVAGAYVAELQNEALKQQIKAEMKEEIKTEILQELKNQES